MAIDYGKAAEHLFMFNTLSRGLIALQPTCEDIPYDMIVDNGTKTIKIQIKSTHTMDNRYDRYRIVCKKKNYTRYNKKDCDFIACYIFQLNVWYVIPVELIKKLAIHLYPHREARGNARRFEKFREAWHLLKE